MLCSVYDRVYARWYEKNHILQYTWIALEAKYFFYSVYFNEKQ